jgi:hypothetical protein
LVEIYIWWRFIFGGDLSFARRQMIWLSHDLTTNAGTILQVLTVI